MKGAAVWQLSSNVLSMLLAMVQISILARCFDAEQFGLIAIVMVVVNICQGLSDLGISNYLIHRQENSNKIYSTVFWLCMGAGIGLFAIVAMASPIISAFYDNKKLVDLLVLASFSFVCISMFSQIQACYVKFKKIKTLSVIEMLSKVSGFILVMFLLWVGKGIEIIIWGNLSVLLIKLILLMVFSDSDWRPRFQFCSTEAKNAWGYGIYQLGSQLMYQIRMNLDVIVLGLYVDKSQLGLYSLAKQLVSKPVVLFSPVINRLSISILAESQSDKVNLNKSLSFAHEIIVAIVVFVYVLMAINAKGLTFFLYGEGNMSAYQYLIPLSIFWCFRYAGGALVAPLVQAIGKTSVDFKWNFSTSILFFICLFGFSRFSALTAVWSLCILQVTLLFFVYHIFHWKMAEVSKMNFFMPMIKYSTYSVICGLTSYIFIDMAIDDLLVMFMSSVMLASVLYIAFLYRDLKRLIL